VPEPLKLLTPSEVAELLQIAEKTVYKHSKSLCGFKPAGLGFLRFRREIIYGIMEGQDPRRLVLQFPVSERTILNQGLQNKKRSIQSTSRQKKRIKEGSTAAGRHGLV